jgi:hypothetical protein
VIDRAASDQAEMHGSKRGLIENTIRKQWLSTLRALEPCKAGKAEGPSGLARECDPHGEERGPARPAALEGRTMAAMPGLCPSRRPARAGRRRTG